MAIGPDSTICEVHRKTKQGTAYGYIRLLGYHPLMATRANTGEVIPAQLRKGSSNRGRQPFTEELIALDRCTGASGPLTPRANAGCYTLKKLHRQRVVDQREDARLGQDGEPGDRRVSIEPIAYTTAAKSNSETVNVTVSGRRQRRCRLVVRRTNHTDRQHHLSRHPSPDRRIQAQRSVRPTGSRPSTTLGLQGGRRALVSSAFAPSTGCPQSYRRCRHRHPAIMSRTSTNKSIEDVREYWDARPCNIRHSPKVVGSIEYFDEVEARKYLVEPHIPGFAEFDRWAGKRVLEVGCGIGTDSINFARAGAHLTAVDLSSESLRIARQRAEVVGVADRIEFVQANAEELTSAVGDGYDLVYSFGVVHHTPRPDRALEQIRSVIAPRGTLKLMVYHRRSWKVFWIVVTQGRGRFGQTDELVAIHSEAQTGCPVTFSYTRREGRELVEDNGFRVKDLRVDHIFPYRVRDYVEYRFVKEPYFRWMPQQLFRALERRFGWHLLITAEPA